MVGIFRYKRLSAGSKLFLLLLIVTFLTEGSGLLLSYHLKANQPVYWLYVLIQYSCIALAYATELTKSRKVLYQTVWFIGTALSIEAVTKREHIMTTYPSVTKTIATVLILFVTLRYLRQLLEYSKSGDFNHFPLFWFSIGWLSFGVVTLIGFSAFNYIGEVSETYAILFKYIRIFASLVLYTLFIAGFVTRQDKLNQFDNEFTRA